MATTRMFVSQFVSPRHFCLFVCLIVLFKGFNTKFVLLLLLLFVFVLSQGKPALMLACEDQHVSTNVADFRWSRGKCFFFATIILLLTIVMLYDVIDRVVRQQ